MKIKHRRDCLSNHNGDKGRYEHGKSRHDDEKMCGCGHEDTDVDKGEAV